MGTAGSWTSFHFCRQRRLSTLQSHRGAAHGRGAPCDLCSGRLCLRGGGLLLRLAEVNLIDALQSCVLLHVQVTVFFHLPHFVQLQQL